MTAKSNVAEKDKAAQKKNDKMLPDGPDWTFNLLEQYHVEIKRVAQHYRLDTYPNQIEVSLRANDGCLLQYRYAHQLQPLVIW